MDGNFLSKLVIMKSRKISENSFEKMNEQKKRKNHFNNKHLYFHKQLWNSTQKSLTDWVLNFLDRKKEERNHQKWPTQRLMMKKISIKTSDNRTENERDWENEKRRTNLLRRLQSDESVMMLSNQNSYISLSNSQKCILRYPKTSLQEIFIVRRWCLISFSFFHSECVISEYYFINFDIW